jgi:hypothetical protein
MVGSFFLICFALMTVNFDDREFFPTGHVGHDT